MFGLIRKKKLEGVLDICVDYARKDRIARSVADDYNVGYDDGMINTSKTIAQTFNIELEENNERSKTV